MLSYETCKQLKEAGFPQKGNQGYYLNEADKICFTADTDTTDTAGIIIEYSDPEHKNISKTSKAYIAIVPTLPELIKACGEGFWKLEKCDENWQAKSIFQIPDGFASTPEEAVAKLWLELNKK